MATDDSTTDIPTSGGALKQTGWVGPASDRLEQQVHSGFRGIVDKFEQHPTAPQWTLMGRLASVAELKKLADEPPSGIVKALAPALCPTLAWAQMFDPSAIPSGARTERGGWSASDHFKSALRALQNGWYEDALESFRESIEEKPEDFVALYGMAQLLRYWTGDAEAALPLFERAARYAVPVGAKPWMKKFAAESFISGAELLVMLHDDHGLAHQHLSNAEEHIGPNPEIDLARARISARTGNEDEVQRHIANAIEHGWFYAIQVAIDPAFPASVAGAVLSALDSAKSNLQSAAEEKVSSVTSIIDTALAGDDPDQDDAQITSARQRLTDLRQKAERLADGDDVSLLASLSLGDRLDDVAKLTKSAAEQLESLRLQIQKSQASADVAEEMADLSAQRDTLQLTRQRLAEVEGSAGKEVEEQKQVALEQLKKDAIRNGIKRALAWIVPAIVLFIIYSITQISTSPSFSIGMRGSAPAAAGGDDAPSAPTQTVPSPTGPSQTVPAQDLGRGALLQPAVPSSDVAAPTEAVGPGPTGYHAKLDGLMKLLLVVYILAIAAMVVNKEWAEIQMMTKAIERKYATQLEEQIADAVRRRGPAEAELKRVTARIEELRAKIQ